MINYQLRGCCCHPPGLRRIHPNYIPVKEIDYSTGLKFCMNCDGAIIVGGLAGLSQPRGNKSLDTKQQYHGENSKETKAATLRRH